MIFDHAEQAQLYRAIHPRLAQALDFLTNTNLAALENRKHVIEGEVLFALVNEYTTKPLADCRFESHRRYTDIQWMVSGGERIGVTNIANLTVTEPFVAERDIAFYQGSGDFITLVPRTFAIFFPHDGHQPSIAVTDPSPVRKIVMKVDLNS